MSRRRSRHLLEREQTMLPLQTTKNESSQVQTKPISTSDRSSGSLMHLQSVVGNVALQRMLANSVQRDPTDVAEATAPVKLLSSSEVVKALSYYAGRKKDYTPAIISRIQVQLGLAPTGIADEVMVQAVAEFQSRQPSLKVDGMAGPRTMPAAFPSGLESEAHQEQFTEDASKVQDDWAGLDDADKRAEALMESVNEILKDSDVPECEFVFSDLSGSLAQFDFTLWTIELDKKAFEQDTLSNEETADAANTVYHEARHAEQWFRMAQMLAGQGKKSNKIAEMMGIPVEQANDAVSNPLAPGTVEALIADGWYQSVYGVSARQREKVFSDLTAADKEIEAAQKAVKANASKANEKRLQRALEARKRAFDAYHDLPEENDAHRVGDAITARLLIEDK